MLITAIIFLLIAVAVFVLSRPMPAWLSLGLCILMVISSILVYIFALSHQFLNPVSIILAGIAILLIVFADPYLLRIISKIAAIVICVVIISVSIASIFPKTNAETQTETTQPSATVSTAKEQALAQAKQVLEDAGWKDSDYTLEAVDPSIDGSTTGQGAFYQGGVHNAIEMVTFLKTGTSSAAAIIDSIISSTGATKEEVLNAENWIAVQPKVPFSYTGNTGFVNGESLFLGNRAGASGDIFMIFVSSTTDKATAVRGAYSNPQTKIPTPTPKSSNPADYKQPGDGPERDSGTGTKPKAVVTTPPEASPPTVVETTQSPTGVTDSSVAKPGTETGVSAPGTAPGSTTNEPPVEANVNPPVGGNNVVGIENPFK